MARTIDQIQAELNAAYQPQADIVNQQIAALPQYYGEQQQALDVARQNAYRDILGGASARGLAYSGMPIAEQTRYMGTKYLPALAGLAQQQSQQRASLQSALNDIYSQRLQRAQAIQQQELDREQQQRQFEQQLTLQREMAAMQARAYGGGGSSSIAPTRESYNSDLADLEANLRAFQAAGYRGKLPSKDQTVRSGNHSISWQRSWCRCIILFRPEIKGQHSAICIVKFFFSSHGRLLGLWLLLLSCRW